jgi:trimeric autotransporter adhesin
MSCALNQVDEERKKGNEAARKLVLACNALAGVALARAELAAMSVHSDAPSAAAATAAATAARTEAQMLSEAAGHYKGVLELVTSCRTPSLLTGEAEITGSATLRAHLCAPASRVVRGGAPLRLCWDIASTSSSSGGSSSGASSKRPRELWARLDLDKAKRLVGVRVRFARTDVPVRTDEAAVAATTVTTTSAAIAADGDSSNNTSSSMNSSVNGVNGSSGQHTAATTAAATTAQAAGPLHEPELYYPKTLKLQATHHAEGGLFFDVKTFTLPPVAMTRPGGVLVTTATAAAAQGAWTEVLSFSEVARARAKSWRLVVTTWQRAVADVAPSSVIELIDSDDDDCAAVQQQQPPPAVVCADVELYEAELDVDMLQELHVVSNLREVVQRRSAAAATAGTTAGGSSGSGNGARSPRSSARTPPPTPSKRNGKGKATAASASAGASSSSSNSSVLVQRTATPSTPVSGESFMDASSSTAAVLSLDSLPTAAALAAAEADLQLGFLAAAKATHAVASAALTVATTGVTEQLSRIDALRRTATGNSSSSSASSSASSSRPKEPVAEWWDVALSLVKGGSEAAVVERAEDALDCATELQGVAATRSRRPFQAFNSVFGLRMGLANAAKVSTDCYIILSTHVQCYCCECCP